MAKPRVIDHDFNDRFDSDPERSYNLAAAYYVDPVVYEKEKACIFYRSWNFVCHAGQVRDIGSNIDVHVTLVDIASGEVIASATERLNRTRFAVELLNHY